jgi:nicotinamide-nucleotide amidase
VTEAAGPATASTAGIIAIGSEMLGPLRQDTNSLWLSARLEELGIPVVRKSVVGDDPALLAEELSFLARSAHYVITTGGLGPTADDVTVAAVAAWLGAPLRRDEVFLEKMRERFARRGFEMPACNAKQADFIVGATLLENPKGTAPGFWAVREGVEVVILPGVPSEMREIMESSVLPVLRERAGGVVGRRRVLRIAGMGESAVEELVAPVYAKWKDDPVTILASPGEVQLHLAVRGEPAAADARLAAMEADFRAVLGARIFGEDAEDLARAVGRLLRDGRKTLALAESCTGGMVASLVTDVPGSSEYFQGALVTYANAAKEDLLGVESAVLREAGAVSDRTALAMARGAQARFDADVAVSVTGIAGPDGGSAEKPVGTVYFGLADRDGATLAKKRLFIGDRAVIRRAASLQALELLRRHLVGEQA